MGIIYFTEKNVHGAWVIYGTLGVRQYYFYTKKRAMKKIRGGISYDICKE